MDERCLRKEKLTESSSNGGGKIGGTPEGEGVILSTFCDLL
jgi:hypothetical protein